MNRAIRFNVISSACILALTTGATAAAEPPTPTLVEAVLYLDRAQRPDQEPDSSPWTTWDGSVPFGLAWLTLGLYRALPAQTDLDLCAFTPSCSHFADQAIQRFGLWRGVLLGADRLLRDHPGAMHLPYSPAVDGIHLSDPVQRYETTPCLSCSP